MIGIFVTSVSFLSTSASVDLLSILVSEASFEQVIGMAEVVKKREMESTSRNTHGWSDTHVQLG